MFKSLKVRNYLIYSVDTLYKEIIQISQLMDCHENDNFNNFSAFDLPCSLIRYSFLHFSASVFYP